MMCFRHVFSVKISIWNYSMALDFRHGWCLEKGPSAIIHLSLCSKLYISSWLSGCRRQLDDLDEPGAKLLGVLLPSYLIGFNSWHRLALKVKLCPPKARILSVGLPKTNWTVGVDRMFSERCFNPSCVNGFCIFDGGLLCQSTHLILPLVKTVWTSAVLFSDKNGIIIAFKLRNNLQWSQPQVATYYELLVAAQYLLPRFSSHWIRLMKRFPTASDLNLTT